ncbi:MAG: class I SAM-dependent methyltransferase [Chloroflexota bacterium]
MQPNVAQQLIELNRRFYQSFADSFSQTRQRLQTGVVRVLDTIQPTATILDLGCGNGELARELGQHGHSGGYLGLDFSAGLLEAARENAPGFAEFMQADLSAPGWDKHLAKQRYDIILCFATMHHIPGDELRISMLNKVGQLLNPGGKFVHSNWQPLDSERLRERVLPWDKIGLSEAVVDPGDLLMDWRRDGNGLRYVHQYNEGELAELARETGFNVVETFLSDGEGGKLGLYGVWGR